MNLEHRPLPCGRVAFALLATVVTASLPAQVDRYELGLRLRAFERELAATADPARRAPAFAALERAVQAFFRLDTNGVAAAIEDATWALRGTTPSPAERWARALQVQLDARLIGCGDGTIEATVSLVSATRRREDRDAGDDVAASTERPGNAVFTVTIAAPDAKPIVFSLGELPQTLALPRAGLPPGDHVLRWTLRQGDHELAHREQGLSLAVDLESRLSRLETMVKANDTPADLERATLAQLVRTLRGMTRHRAEETILPGARLLTEAEALAALEPGTRFYGPLRTGQFWLRVPTAAETATVRLCVPAAVAIDVATVPLVVALHGAGGSENLFCDGYGDGEIVRQCEQRGWLLVSPRSQGMTGVDVPALVDALAERYPIDRDAVFVVGHSMGAMQAVANAMRQPERYRAVAALGGGGAVRKVAGLPALPFFVGTGTRDFLQKDCATLHQKLEAQGATVTFREYADVEHLAVVQIALPDVFAFFDQVLQR